MFYVSYLWYDGYAGFASEQQSMSVDVIRKAFQATEEGFVSLVSRNWPMKPQIAAVGSCCLVGVICNGTLYIANLGDSRAVLGRVVKATGEVLPIQLSSEHNVSIESVRQEMHSQHPDDSQIVVLKHNVWRVKGLIQVRLLLLAFLLSPIFLPFCFDWARILNNRVLLCVATLFIIGVHNCQMGILSLRFLFQPNYILMYLLEVELSKSEFLVVKCRV